MIKRIIIFSLISLLIILVSSSFAAKTLVGYVNGEKLLMGVAYNNKWRSLMLTTNNGSCDWDNLSEPFHSYSEDWQTHPAGFPADWRASTGASVYNVVTGADNILQALAFSGVGRIMYGALASDTTWQTPVDFSVTAKNIQLQYEATPESGFSILRIGFAGQGGTGDFGPPQVSATGLYAYQFYNSTLIDYAHSATEHVWGIPRMVSIRDGQNIPLHAISYSGYTSGATLTFRLVVREPIPVEFCDANKDTLSTIPSSGAYIKVEALDPLSYDSATRDNTMVTLWTTSGDTESIQLTELFDAQTTVGTFFSCVNNVFINDSPISVSTSLSVIPAFIRLNPGQNTTFLAIGNPIGTNNSRIDGFGRVTAYVAYNGSTASAPVTCSGAAPFTWQSSDTTAGSIDSATGVFTANGNGIVTITATDANGFTGTATVQILTTDAPIAVETPSVYLHQNELFEIVF